eukprot:CAMPEP_0196803950 /NCGR_PEP_ID=MMETSP1362-20130617/3454_1 /TAXON_ID=163516 /ORGANISM="Leptocylindrus danicus, Strain CCMP1856" /LENGTH=96 /DNA_ID=CAMNT_0042175879 /DNA_START=18 /DNA_END=308 /DNA_ORIENTATION=+
MAARPSIKVVELVAREIFGHAPQLNIRTGNSKLRKPMTGAYLARYYPEPIEKAARTVDPSYTSFKEGRRLEKLKQLRLRGKGPPKKGAGKRQQKKR